MMMDMHAIEMDKIERIARSLETIAKCMLLE